MQSQQQKQTILGRKNVCVCPYQCPWTIHKTLLLFHTLHDNLDQLTCTKLMILGALKTMVLVTTTPTTLFNSLNPCPCQRFYKVETIKVFYNGDTLFPLAALINPNIYSKSNFFIIWTYSNIIQTGKDFIKIRLKLIRLYKNIAVKGMIKGMEV